MKAETLIKYAYSLRQFNLIDDIEYDRIRTGVIKRKTWGKGEMNGIKRRI